MSILNSQLSIPWRSQFTDPVDFEAAGELLRKFKFVSATEFKRDLRRLILQTFPPSQRAAFYIERELARVKPVWPYKKPDGRKVVNKLQAGVFQPMYHEVSSLRGNGKPKRWTASGVALPATRSPNHLRQEIGSEGVVASLVSRICLSDSARFVMHPHTREMARISVENLVVVTDFIGSGKRTWDMLDSLWRLASVRSWRSSGYRKLTVICYAATEQGLSKVSRHPCRPNVVQVRSCPTISNSFKGIQVSQLEELCQRFPQGAKDPLGYGNVGALIAFEHSCPNNVPAMFRMSNLGGTSRWAPLFPKRSSEDFSEFTAIDIAEEQLAALDAIGCRNIGSNSAFSDSSVQQRAMIILLAALYRGRRNSDDLVSATRLSYVELLIATDTASKMGLLNKSGRLTASGFTLVGELNKPVAIGRSVSFSANTDYYPTSLRAPI